MLPLMDTYVLKGWVGGGQFAQRCSRRMWKNHQKTGGNFTQVLPLTGQTKRSGLIWSIVLFMSLNF